jgi:hypothetical protein
MDRYRPGRAGHRGTVGVRRQLGRHRQGHRVRRGIADRVVHHDRQGLRGRQPGGEGHVQLRRQLRARDADQPGRAGGRVRLRRPGEHEDGDRRGQRRRHPDHVRAQPARHRRTERQSEGRHRPVRPDQARGEGRALRRTGPVRHGGEEGTRRRQGHHHAGHPGAGCEGGVVEGEAR